MKEIKLDGRRCKSCGICIALCPKRVFDADGEKRPVASRAEDCIGCRLCELRCPDFALRVEERK